MNIVAVSDPLTLPCGLKLPNRLAKASLAEALTDKTHLPNKLHDSIYTQWGEGDWGAILTGNVQVDEEFLGDPGDTTTSPLKSNRDATVARWRELATKTQAHGTPLLMQLCHPGRQSPLGARSKKPIAPSPVPMDIGSGVVAKIARVLMFGSPQEMSLGDIQKVIEQFASAASVAMDAGFSGIQVHGAHGYLLTQFLNPQTNQRTDAYGGSPKKRARIVKEIVAAVRKATSRSFCIGIKLNSADHQHENGLEESLEQLDEILTEPVDFIEISGGTYEKPDFIGGKDAGEKDASETKDLSGNAPSTARTGKREAFFLEYAMEVRKRHPQVALMVTGGFRTRQGMDAALKSGACDIIGLGRPATVEPQLPKEKILNKMVADKDAEIRLDRVEIPCLAKATGIKPISAGIISLHFRKEIRQRATARAR